MPAVKTLIGSEESHSYFPEQGVLNQSAQGSQWQLCEENVKGSVQGATFETIFGI